ncbi:uncharacterized protein LOC143508642 [Brachyhypopomus gauderio]|uniref:uncharacterized protein LOC143508642 n=1 Tax=Brachyhypopomus gauderio TaxID=698409 RepID=UPI0040422455
MSDCSFFPVAVSMKTDMLPMQRIVKSLIFLSFIIELQSTPACLTRRCLANELMNKTLISAPQSQGCHIAVNLTSVQYETLSVDTNKMKFSSRIKINMEWKDPDTAWSDSLYKFKELVLPDNKIWTPELTIDNAIYLTVKPVSNNVVVRCDGTVSYALLIEATVGCKINLLTYPFAQGTCPVALNGWNQSLCELQVLYGSVTLVGVDQGEWQTLSVELCGVPDGSNRNYLRVNMSTNPFKALVSLILPSALIMVADLVSFALPLDGGKRSSFKITLVLSFTMFLLILTDYIPDNGPCSPLIRYHFCFCLFVLVLSMLTSMVFTKLATDGSLRPCKRVKKSTPDPKLKAAVLKPSHLTADGDALEKIVNFVENLNENQRKMQKRQNFANYLDKICFWTYLSIDIIYSICVIVFTKADVCTVNNLDFLHFMYFRVRYVLTICVFVFSSFIFLVEGVDFLHQTEKNSKFVRSEIRCKQTFREKTDMASSERILKYVCIFSYLLVFWPEVARSQETCVSRRCLANELISKDLFSPPQPPSCRVDVNLTSIQYETLSVDTKTLRFTSRIVVQMAWIDPDLAWKDKPQYNFSELMLPADTIWTPDLTVDNAVDTEVKPVSTDILVKRDGTVLHAIQLYITVVCALNLFTYPFVLDSCPVALNGWSDSSCGLQFQYGDILPVGKSRGEWQTMSVELRANGRDQNQNYLSVTMYTNPFDTIVTLLLPSILILMADLVSFALPLDGGKRSSFKITLVLSFTMSLLILTDNLPDTGICSPMIRYHFCFCLIVLVVSLLTSMVLSRLAADGSLLLCPAPRRHAPDHAEAKDNHEKEPGVNGAVSKVGGVLVEDSSMRAVVAFLNNMEMEHKETKWRLNFANRFDKICFMVYLCIDIIYVIAVIAISRTDFCKVNNLDFWK